MNHAVAAVEVNNTLLILDQHLPPIEPGDYAEYVAPKLAQNPTVTVYTVEIQGGTAGIPVITGWFDATLELSDTYPEDRLPDTVFQEAARRAAAQLGLELSSTLETVIEQRLAYKVQMTYGLWLGAVTGKATPVTVLYTPILSEHWIEYIASILAETVREAYSESVEAHGSMAATHGFADVDKSHGDAFYVYAIPLAGLHVLPWDKSR